MVSERGNDARDNGYVFFRYLTEKHPEINAYFVIDYDSADYDKVKKLGNCVKYKSFDHYMMLCQSKYNVSTHIMGYTPNMIVFVWLDRAFNIIRGKKVFLQHGIIKDNMVFNHYPHTKVDIFNTSAKPEYDYIKENYGHPDGVVQLLGMCRYDNLPLEPNTKNQILLMPTWRISLANSCKTDSDFIKTSYFKAFNSLINNEDLINLLDENDINLVFYPHVGMQKYLHLFQSTSSRVICAPYDKYDVQRLLIESKVLITDYSSVYFDFAYMDKPEIFYQFDQEEYRSGHYAEGYFSYERDGFGPVFTDEKHVVEEIRRVLKRSCIPDSIYKERMESFFTLRDKNNCNRIFDAIVALD